MTPSLRIGPEDIDLAAEYAALQAGGGDIGGIASFLGIVRAGEGAEALSAMTLEHYAGMTEAAIAEMAAEAASRWALLGCRVIHRIGRIPAGGRIVLVLTAARHRQAALDATAFLIDRLKTGAPFWKQEHLLDGRVRWVDARAEDEVRAQRWE